MTTTALPALDELLLEWVQCARIGRSDKQSLLLDALLDPIHPSSDETTRSSLRVLERISASATDVLRLRQLAAVLTVSVDVEQVRAALAADCAMELRIGDTTQVFVGLDAAEAIATELCAQQQSLVTSPARASTRTTDHGLTAGGTACVRASSSAPHTWLVDPSAPLVDESAASTSRRMVASHARDPFEDGPLRVGTLVTYYEDVEKAHTIFSVHTVFTFAAEDQRIERIVRTLQTRDGSSAAEALVDVHFGYLLEKSLHSTCL